MTKRQSLDWRRFAPLAALLAALAFLFASGLDRYVTIEMIRAHRAALIAWTEANPLLAGALCMATSAALMAMGFPSLGIPMAAAALIFGFWQGFALTLVGATAGGFVLFMAARNARDGVMGTGAGPLLERLENGAKGDGFLYLLTLRLIPVFPTGVVTLAAAAARLSVRAFIPATLLGCVPAGLAFASLGVGVGGALDASGEVGIAEAMLRPQIIVPLAALAVLALLASVMRAWLKRG
jgi:uncharacterized membrane protein YdjX (TVP38/TMEM64 family)